MRYESVTIRETDLGWLNKHTGRYHKTACHALRSTLAAAKKLARSGANVCTLINWEPTTHAGELAVSAITNTEKEN